MRARLRHWIVTTFNIVALPLVAAIIAGVIYERVGEWRDRKRFPQIGHSVDIGGRSLNIYCLGEGSPTVILEGDLNSPGYSWVLIQREVAKFARACWYDRAGYGWSDPGPFPHHSDSIARDLHMLLAAAHVPPPYVLVGHGLGGFHVRVYRGFYPGEVAGLVLVDPLNEDMTIHIHNHNEALRPTVLWIFRALGAMGFFRGNVRSSSPPPEGLTADEWAAILHLTWQPKAIAETLKEVPFWVDGEQARASGSFGDIPVEVLSAGIQDQDGDPKLDANHPLKMELQGRLARLSTRGTRRVVSNSGHGIPLEAPNSVITAVREVVAQVRDGHRTP